MSKSRKYLIGLIVLLVSIVGYAFLFGESTGIDCGADGLDEADTIYCLVEQIDQVHFDQLRSVVVDGKTIEIEFRSNNYDGFTRNAPEDIVRVVCSLMDAGYSNNRFSITARAPHPASEGDFAMIAVLTNESTEGMACRAPRGVELQNYTVDFENKWIK